MLSFSSSIEKPFCPCVKREKIQVLFERIKFEEKFEREKKPFSFLVVFFIEFSQVIKNILKMKDMARPRVAATMVGGLLRQK